MHHKIKICTVRVHISPDITNDLTNGSRGQRRQTELNSQRRVNVASGLNHNETATKHDLSDLHLQLEK